MPEINKSDLKDIIKRIDRGQILLPDFQRDFIWKDEERQKKIVASVLAKMPIGSILLLESKPDEYSSKVIGLKTTLDTSKMPTDDVQFLLDGQQRITVLSNVFSSTIHDKCEKVTDLVSPSLKKRFFLLLPKWADVVQDTDTSDLFGIKRLLFPMQSADSDDPEFLSSDILPSILALPFSAKDNNPYNPKFSTTSMDLVKFCTSYKDGYLVPLYMIIPPLDGRNNNEVYMYGEVIRRIADNISTEIKSEYKSLFMDSEQRDFIKKVVADSKLAESILSHEGSERNDGFFATLNMRQSVWAGKLTSYLDSCISNLNLHQIQVKASQRVRAIDIYENLNLGGVSLNTFDLIMAKVAKVDKKNFKDRITEAMAEKKDYTRNVLPDYIDMIIGKDIDTGIYNATEATECYSVKNNEIQTKYVDVFLDVMGMCCYNPALVADEFKIDYMKKDKILKIDPNLIHKNCERIIKAIDRAMFFLQTRCGIRNIRDVNYTLIIVILSLAFVEDKYFFDKKVHDLLEAWYWSSILSGEFDKDQNDTCIKNLKNIFRTLRKETSTEWIDGDNRMKVSVLNAHNFSDKPLLLLDRTNEDRYPKQVLRSFLCEYMLAMTYPDMFDGKYTISVFCDQASDLQAHHIIPLGSVKKIGDMNTVKMRKDDSNICNSPLNFVYITASSNRKISDFSLKDYVGCIDATARTKLHITAYSSAENGDTSEKIHNILAERYDRLYGEIQGHINTLLLKYKS